MIQQKMSGLVTLYNKSTGLLKRQWYRHWPMLVILLPCLLLGLGGAKLRILLRYDRSAILDHGEYWRLLSGNLVHLGSSHLLLDMAGLVLLWLLLGEALPGWRWPLATLVGCLAVGLGLLIFDPGLTWYVGISGALNTLWAAGALLMLWYRRPGGGLLTIFLVAKIGWEQQFGPLPLSVETAGGAVIVNAHLYGAVGGVAVAMVTLAYRALRRRPV